MWVLGEGANKSVGSTRENKLNCGFSEREQVKVWVLRQGVSKGVGSPREIK